jgi:polysaccharide export outer membrane protein
MLDKTTFMRTLKDVSQIFYQFGLGAAALKVLKD